MPDKPEKFLYCKNKYTFLPDCLDVNGSPVKWCLDYSFEILGFRVFIELQRDGKYHVLREMRNGDLIDLISYKEMRRAKYWIRHEFGDVVRMRESEE